MYEQVPVHQVINFLTHIYSLYRRDAGGEKRRAREYRTCQELLRRTIDNLKRGKSSLSPATLGELSRQAKLTIGSALSLVGYPLDQLREVEIRLNGHRTRIIESYPFDQDRKIDLPKVLTNNAFGRTALLSEIVRDWQTEIPIRVLRGPAWRRKFFYAQVGVEDLGLSGIPPGAFLAVEPISDHLQRWDDPFSMYFLQFKNGYRCSRCVVSDGKLTLLPYSHRYFGRHEFLYPHEVRIVGQIRGFVASFPPSTFTPVESRRAPSKTPLIFPWEQPSLNALLRTESLRLGLDRQKVERANEVLKSLLDITVSERTLRRYHHGAETNPSAGVLVALCLIHSVRFSDVLRLVGLLRDESEYFSLSTWLRAATMDELRSVLHDAITPTPSDAWDYLMREWGAWPTLISIIIPGLRKLENRILRIEQDKLFPGLPPSIRPGTFALIDELGDLPDTGADRDKDEWGRPIYALQHKQDILCGYLDRDEEHFTLIPHPRSRARRISFLRRQVEIIGRLIVVASPLA